MPSPVARQLTQRHRRELALLAAAVTRRVEGVARQADPEDIEAWWQRVVEVLVTAVTQGWSAAAALERRYQRQHAVVEGAEVEPVVVPPVEEQIETALRVTGPVAFLRHMRSTGDALGSRSAMVSTLRGSSERMTLAGSRETAMATFQRSPAVVGWRRVGAASPCAFCSMLVSRGAVYSESTADFRAHDSCRCTAEPLHEREQEPASVTALRAEWDQATAGVTGRAKLTAWRRHLAGETDG